MKLKKFLSCVCTIAVLCGTITLNVFASTDEMQETTENEGINTLQSLEEITFEELEAQEFKSLEDISSDSFEQIPNVSGMNKISRDAWRITQPVFVGSGTLDESFDSYLVTFSDTKFSFLKLESDNPNLIALLYNVDENGYLSDSTGWGVRANQDYNYINIPKGQYAIIIGSASGNETGDYKLMWNCSNKANPKSLVDVTSDLSRVILYYDLDTICSNGTNILDHLTWEEHETWYTSYGYSARDMKITAIGENGERAARGVYLGTFSSSAPYSTSKALLVNVNHGTWTYANSYYQNIGGDVKHIIDYFDLSGLKTPRIFGEGADDFSYGPNYIIIDLNSFKVCEFLSPFNYHYSKDGGRTYTLTNLTRID